MLHRTIDQRIQHLERLNDIVVEILAGLDYRFSNMRVCREMQHGLDPILGYHLADQLLISDIALDERSPLHRPPVAGAEIIQGNGLESRLRQTLRGMTAYVPGAASK